MIRRSIPSTLGMVMIGLSLFKSGFLAGRSSTRRYAIVIATGAVALAIVNGRDQPASPLGNRRSSLGSTADLVIDLAVTLRHGTIRMGVALPHLRPFSSFFETKMTSP
jgi:hypothetical protein